MYTAKVIRHRHKTMTYINDDLKGVGEVSHFKIVFSHPNEMKLFKDWIAKNKGLYDYNKIDNVQLGKLPKKIVTLFGEDICWCDVMSYYLSHVANYRFHSTLSPYKGDVYFKEI